MKRAVGRSAGEDGRQPGGGEAENVGQIMGGVGDQGDGAAKQAIDDFGNDEADIEDDTDQERLGRSLPAHGRGLRGSARHGSAPHGNAAA